MTNRTRRGVSLVSLVSFVGTIAIAVGMVQSDAVLTALRRATLARVRARLRTAAVSAAAALPKDATATLPLGATTLRVQKDAVIAETAAPALRRTGDRRPLAVRVGRE